MDTDAPSYHSRPSQVVGQTQAGEEGEVPPPMPCPMQGIQKLVFSVDGMHGPEASVANQCAC